MHPGFSIPPRSSSKKDNRRLGVRANYSLEVRQCASPNLYWQLRPGLQAHRLLPFAHQRKLTGSEPIYQVRFRVPGKLPTARVERSFSMKNCIHHR